MKEAGKQNLFFYTGKIQEDCKLEANCLANSIKNSYQFLGEEEMEIDIRIW